MENAKELLLVADAVSKEKGLSREDVLDAISEGMETSLRRNFPEGANIRIVIDEHSGLFKGYRLYTLVDQIENVEAEMLFSEIEDEEVREGYVWEEFQFVLNRQQFAITKQVALQRIKNDSRDNQIQSLLSKSITLLSGIVKVVRKDQLIVDCNGLDITIYRRSMLPKENFKNGDKIFFVLEQEKNHYVGTRISDEYLKEVFKREIVEIEEGDIEITSVSRIPGFRSKVVVKSLKRNIDAVKSCIGSRGMHIKNIQSFLGGEVVDVIEYHEEPAQLLIKAMNPVNITRIIIDEENHSIDIAVSDAEIAQAIGRGGKNIEMITKLLGWQINVFSEAQWKTNNDVENKKYIAILTKGLDCDEEVAEIIMQAGYDSLEEIAYLPKDEFYVEEFDEQTHEDLRSNARIVCQNPEELRKVKGYGDLISLGLEEEEVNKLQAENIINMHDFSELSTYDLEDVLPAVDTDKAKVMIMSARKQQELLHDNIS